MLIVIAKSGNLTKITWKVIADRREISESIALPRTIIRVRRRLGSVRKAIVSKPIRCVLERSHSHERVVETENKTMCWLFQN